MRERLSLASQYFSPMNRKGNNIAFTPVKECEIHNISPQTPQHNKERVPMNYISFTDNHRKKKQPEKMYNNISSKSMEMRKVSILFKQLNSNRISEKNKIELQNCNNKCSILC